jgi:hypothetical protein
MESVGRILSPVAINIQPFSRKTCEGCNNSQDSTDARSSEQSCYAVGAVVHLIILAQQFLLVVSKRLISGGLHSEMFALKSLDGKENLRFRGVYPVILWRVFGG